MFDKMFSKAGFRTAVLVAPLLLAACATTDFYPGPMPTGYTYHNRPYKAVPGPRPILMKKNLLEDGAGNNGGENANVSDYSPSWSGGTSMPAMPVNSDWDHAAMDLIDRMIAELGQPAEPVYVLHGNYPQFEQALRNAMMARNIPVTLVHGDGPFMIQYMVTPSSGSEATMANITLLVSKATPVEDVGGMYNVGDATSAAAMPAATDPVPMDGGPVETAPMPIMPMDNGN